MHSGLDVNVKFTGYVQSCDLIIVFLDTVDCLLTKFLVKLRVNNFEFTEACTVFDLLDISLYHGWVVDPQATETVAALGHMGYNQLVEMIIQDKMADDSSKVTRGDEGDL